MTETFSAREAASNHSGEAARPEARACLLIRLWTLPRADVDPALRSWSEESGEVAMLADLVNACHGRLAGSHQQQLTAEFADVATAVMAAKRMQRAMIGFASHQPRARVAAAIGVHSRTGESPSAAAATHDGSEAAGLLMRAATAGQILLTQTAYAEMSSALPQTSRAISPMRLDTVRPDTMNGGPAAKAYELVWAEPEIYLRLRKLVEGMEWAHATASHRGQLTTKRLADIPPAATGADPPTVRDAGEPAHVDGQPAAPGRSWGSNRIKLGVAAAIVVAATAVTATVMLTARRDAAGSEPQSRAPAPVTAPRPREAPAPEVVKPSAGVRPVTAANGAAAPQPEVAPRQPGGTGNTADDKSKHEVPKEPGAAPAVGSAPPRVGREPVEGFYRRDIPDLMQRADRESGNGNYESAKYLYGIVRQLEPGNAAARQGLDRATRAQALDEH